MGSADHLALMGLLLAAIVQAVAVIIWGATLNQRVVQLEEEIKPLKAMPEKLAVMTERMDSLIEQFRDLNSAIRWMRDPALENSSTPHGRK